MTKANLTLEEWLDDLCVRFIINLPEDDLKDIPRICFQVEEAQWFYEDFIRPLDPSLPSMSLRNFCLRIFAHCPLLSPFSQGHHMRAFEDFLAYKTRVPVRGAIMLNAAMDSVVLVKGWKKGASWSFPRGKIAKDEDDLTCGIREVYEETGFDLEAAGLVPSDRNVKSIEVNMREQQMRLFVFRDVPMDTHFEPRTRKEISKIQWWQLSELPAFRKKNQQQQQNTVQNSSKFYMVAPFLVPLRKWVIEQKKRAAKRSAGNQYLSAGLSHDELMTEDDPGMESAAQLPPFEQTARPELNTMEGATATLHRLLKIQPGTEGLQPEAVAQATSQDSGSALLALLKPVVPSQPLADAALHTPLEHMAIPPSIPRSPHHQQPYPSSFSSMPPPPAFPIQPTENTFSYRDTNHQDDRSNNNIVGFQQGHTNLQNPPRPQGNPHSYQPQHLIHPQPLPPPVQRAVFTGGPVHSPAVPQPIQRNLPQPNSNVSNALHNPQFPGLHAPMVPPEVKQTPKLTSHSLALLNAFKGRDQATAEASNSNDLPLRRFTQVPAQQTVASPRTGALELEGAQLSQVAAPPRITVQPNTSLLNPSQLTPRQPISAAQKSTLLDMFKSPTSQPATLAKPIAATALPTSTTPSAVELSAVEPLSTNASTTSALLNDKRAPTDIARDGPMPALNPETNLPFRAVSILARPSKAIEKESPTGTESELDSKPRLNGKKAMPRTGTSVQTSEIPVKAFQPQILKRPQSSPKPPQKPTLREPTISTVMQKEMPQIVTSPSPIVPTSSNLLPKQGSLRMSQSPTANHASGPSLLPQLDRQASQAAEHKQSLLSLFGKATASPTSPPRRDTVSTNVSDMTTAAGRSRVGSLVSGQGTSRRGSQAPISPADKGFLMGYLEAVAKSGR